MSKSSYESLSLKGPCQVTGFFPVSRRSMHKFISPSTSARCAAVGTALELPKDLESAWPAAVQRPGRKVCRLELGPFLLADTEGMQSLLVRVLARTTLRVHIKDSM